MQPIYAEKLSAAQLAELATCYRTTQSIRVRTRAQMILLSAEQHLVPHQIASIVRKDEQTVRRWLRRYQAEGVAGLEDTPRQVGNPKRRRRIAPGYWNSSGDAPGRSASPSRCGPYNA
jgi:hypothetical protein